MKRLLLIFMSVLFINHVNAQVVGLSDKEMGALRMSIDISKTYKKVFGPLLKTAQTALDETPDPIEKIVSQGVLEGDPAKTASLKAVQDARKVYCLALIYRLYGQKVYLDKCTQFLLAWSEVNKATGDPINETKLEDLFTGYDLIRDKISSQNKQIIDNWLETIADAELNSPSSKPGKGTAINNWNSHRIKIITLIAYTLHSEKYIAVIPDLLEKQLAINLEPDGRTHDFIERDAFHYHIYDLEPLLTTAIIINRANRKNYFTYQTDKGASIKKSVDFMIPYMTGQQTHGEFVNSHVPFDLKRAQNNEKGYAAGTLFKPTDGINVFALAAYFDPSYLTVIAQTENNGPSYFNWQIALSNTKSGNYSHN
jgi:hypothetical protein